jgi:tetratricopeptide (TPR) repeat protein
MAEKQAKATPMEAADVIEKAKGFWAKYSKPVIMAGSAVIVLIGGWLIYKYMFRLPKEKEASEKVFAAEKLFGTMASASRYGKDTVNIVLNGDKASGVTGLLKIISSYGSTPAGNRAEYMVGACYLHLKQFDKAIKHLEEFDGNGAYQVQSKAYGMLGHAYAEQKKTGDALSYYKKSASVAEGDELMASEALFIAGRYAEAIGKTKDAIELFQKLNDTYPASQHVRSGDTEKYLARLGITK